MNIDNNDQIPKPRKIKVVKKKETKKTKAKPKSPKPKKPKIVKEKQPSNATLNIDKIVDEDKQVRKVLKFILTNSVDSEEFKKDSYEYKLLKKAEDLFVQEKKINDLPLYSKSWNELDLIHKRYFIFKIFEKIHV